MTVDLIANTAWQGEWALGQVYKSEFSIPALKRVVNKVLEQSDTGYLYLYKGDILPEGIVSILKCTERPNRVYCGNCVAFPDLLSYSVPLSFFNFKPFGGTEEFSTWLVSLENCLIDKSLLKSNFLDTRFDSLAGAGAWWSFQQLFSGAIIRSTPILRHQQEIQPIPLSDQLRIVRYFMGHKWAFWTCLRLIMTGKCFSGFRGIRTLLKMKSDQPLLVSTIDFSGWRKANLPSSPKVSILIPTVDRYPYLFKMLEQLKLQTLKPFEILVIDQTQEESRRAIALDEVPLRVLTMDETGQCRSRNLGLQHATGEYILFLDDDDEVYPELIEDHLRNIAYFNADVSCGLCQEPGIGEAPVRFRMIRMADIFSTNNGMVKRNVLEHAGSFDMAYDRGQKADGDLGARLYRSGALMVINPEIKVLHHRAPSGGLRKHNVRKVTYASSRTTVTHFRLPHVTELYFNLKNLDAVQQREYLWHSIVGTFSIRGSILMKLTKVVWAFLCLPGNLLEIRRRSAMASRIYSEASTGYV
ncbi:MAG: glycosyltransferase family 2 protein [Cyclobacteriaceae bacterium]|nr:glycosyltransferase family 2 protein [Cyclobacteriaceae bacterium]